MEYYYDENNDFYVIKLNDHFDQKEYLEILKNIVKIKKTITNGYYTIMSSDYKYIVVDFNKRYYDEYIILSLIEKKRGK